MAQLRIDVDTHNKLHELARLEGTSMQVVLTKALEEYRRKRFFDSLGAAFGALQNDSEAWAEEQQERRGWANTLLDNTKSNEIWTEDGNVA